MTDRDTLIAEAERRAKSGQLCITAKPALPMARWCDACVIRSLLTLVREDGPRLREYAQHKAGCKAINGVWCVPVFQDGDIMTGLRALSHEEHEASKVCTCGLDQLLRGEDGPREQGDDEVIADWITRHSGHQVTRAARYIVCEPCRSTLWGTDDQLDQARHHIPADGPHHEQDRPEKRSE
jgi:hypothetical protein